MTVKRWLAILFLCYHVSHVEGDEKKVSKKTLRTEKAAIAHIKCSVCQKVFINLRKVIDRARKAIQSKTKAKTVEKGDQDFETSQVEDILNHICRIDHTAGHWLKKLDMVKKGDQRMKVDEIDVPGYCQRECKVLQKTCKEVVRDADLDTVERVFSLRDYKEKLSEEEMAELCKSRTFCTTDEDDLPSLKGWRDEDFEEDPNDPDNEDKDERLQGVIDEMDGLPGMEGFIAPEDVRKAANQEAQMYAPLEEMAKSGNMKGMDEKAMQAKMAEMMQKNPKMMEEMMEKIQQDPKMMAKMKAQLKPGMGMGGMGGMMGGEL